MARYANACLQPFSFSKSYSAEPPEATESLGSPSTVFHSQCDHHLASWLDTVGCPAETCLAYICRGFCTELQNPIIPEAGVDQSADQGVAIIGRERYLKQPINQVALDLGSQACPLPPKYLPPPTITVPKLTLYILHITTRMKALRILPSQIQSKKWESRLKLAKILRSSVAQESRGR